jgi:hypothetical protein
MGQRLELQSLLEDLLGNPNVYFQPPANVQMKYPCIVYQRDIHMEKKFAGNTTYGFTQRYQVTTISRDPDNPVVAKIAALPMCMFSRFFVAESLNHDVFILYF